jgi:tellurite resistance protein TehA-like permease
MTRDPDRRSPGSVAAMRPAPARAGTARATAIPRAAAAPVMGTGIVSVALELDGAHAASDVLFAVAIALALVLGAQLALAARRDARRVAREAASPAGLTFVAALCVLGARLRQAGDHGLATALLVAAAVVWGPVLLAVLRRRPRPAGGDGFLIAVATQAIAVLCAALGAHALALAAFVAGLGLYVWAAMSFDPAEVRTGRGDQWIAGGALAIAALAAATIAIGSAAARPGDAIDTVAFVLWLLAMAWLPVLLAGEVLPPRAGAGPKRWSTVFPVGMYAAMSHAVGHATGRAAIVTFARGWTWVAVAVWAVVAVTSLRRPA